MEIIWRWTDVLLGLESFDGLLSFEWQSLDWWLYFECLSLNGLLSSYRLLSSYGLSLDGLSLDVLDLSGGGGLGLNGHGFFDDSVTEHLF